MLTRKDYVKIAEVINLSVAEIKADAELELIEPDLADISILAHRIADYMATDNPRFDKAKFVEAAIGE